MESKTRRSRPLAWGAGGALGGALLLVVGCQTMMTQTDRQVSRLIEARQEAALHYDAPPDVAPPDEFSSPSAEAYVATPSPTDVAVPETFRAPNQPVAASQPASAPVAAAGPKLPEPKPGEATSLLDRAPWLTADKELAPLVLPLPTETPDGSRVPDRYRATVFTLTDALAYAQRERREYQTAKETLYRAALALTLERHLWTPIFAANLRTIYGNYGEAQNFDQAMRFVADLSVAQRLPYGGEFTAQMIGTLIRDVQKSLTAAEGSEIKLELTVPFLRGAGHVARETLVQLERELTYAVRTFERYRRQQLVLVARSYFELLRLKQRVIDSNGSLERAIADLARAIAVEVTREGDPLDTLRALQRELNAQNSLAYAEESFRSEADQFKIVIGMPVEEPLGLDDLQTIEDIERMIADGGYPALIPPAAVEDEQLAIVTALDRRFDLLTARDQIDDARRGVEISRNAMLPDLNWAGSVTFDTDPAHYNMGAHEFERANWRTELVLSLPLERTAERNALRSALLDTRAAQRTMVSTAEDIRAEVRDAVYQLRLQNISLALQERAYWAADQRADYAALMFAEGEISNRDKIEAEAERLDAQNAVNAAKTARWNAILNFRYVTETLVVDEDGTQSPAAPTSVSTSRPAVPPDAPPAGGD